jgi:argininosuccinate synthase
VENRFVGMKSRGVYETPGGTILLAAHQDLETLTLDREAQALRDSLIPKYAQLIYNGFWYAPEREALQDLITSTQRTVSGEVRLKLYKGNCLQAGRRSPLSLYDEDVASMEGAEEGKEEAYNQNDASGFIALNALRLKASARQRELL